jgi:hypothetical protein
MPTTVEIARHDVEVSEYINTDFSPRHREMIYLLFLNLFSLLISPIKVFTDKDLTINSDKFTSAKLPEINSLDLSLFYMVFVIIFFSTKLYYINLTSRATCKS